ncbi:MAG: hypothetical protein ACAI25_08555, partial [Planctomycetota bacterium]
EDENDSWARYRYRLECVRAGRPELAGLEVGDVVAVEEVESPWVRGSWRGEVLRVFDAGDKYVRPVDRELPYRVKPSAEYLAKGLYLTREDQAVLVLPAMPRAGQVGGHRAAA